MNEHSHSMTFNQFNPITNIFIFCAVSMHCISYVRSNTQ
uniref:Uncharacterized protein n=1 Tax=Anguilla anguilla TaxID=7936 RepID=A0A0E9RU85_ANGAN